jgi:hypothetical protein
MVLSSRSMATRNGNQLSLYCRKYAPTPPPTLTSFLSLILSTLRHSVTKDSPLSLLSPSLQMLSALMLVAKADRLCDSAHDFSQVLFPLLGCLFIALPLQVAVYLLTSPCFHETEVQVSAVEFIHRSVSLSALSSSLSQSLLQADLCDSVLVDDRSSPSNRRSDPAPNR